MLGNVGHGGQRTSLPNRSTCRIVKPAVTLPLPGCILGGLVEGLLLCRGVVVSDRIRISRKEALRLTGFHALDLHITAGTLHLFSS